ncbi:MAG: cytochrome P450 [Verrucomicrobiota bacterium]
MTRFPPGPKSRYPGSGYFQFRKDPLGFLESLAREFGDIAGWKIGRQHCVFVNHPDFIHDVLVTNGHKFLSGLERAKRLLGEGLLTSDGELHRSHRRIMQPAFNHGRIATCAETIAREAERARNRWGNGTPLNMANEMMRLTLIAVARTLFGADLESEAGEIGTALAATMGSPPNMMLPFGYLVEILPLPAIRKMKAGRARLNETVYRLMNERRGNEEADLLSMLLQAQHGTPGMTDEQVRDEVMTILIAGHDTTSTALSWTWYLLSQHPEVEARLHDELDKVLDGRLPTFHDMPALAYTESVVRESMRVYPPVWTMWRRAVADHRINGYVAPAGSLVVMSQHVMHRDPRYFSDPPRFDPERWTPEFKASLPKYAYFPFGGGSRRCLGEGFAWMEAILVIATFAQQWKFRMASGDPVVPRLLFTQRPRDGLTMTALPR